MATSYYDSSYYDWQRQGGEIGAALDNWKFLPFLDKEMRVLDFGCGGGFMLESLPAKERWGIEVNCVAAAEAKEKLDGVVSSIADLRDDVVFDAVISHHALEHVDAPLDTLKHLRTKLCGGGKAIFVVPAESWYQHSKFRQGDINQHLYTWTPLLLGNLFSRAGYRVLSVETLCHRWTPRAPTVRRYLKHGLYDLACRATALLTFYRQLRIVACR